MLKMEVQQKILTNPTACKLPFYLQLRNGHIALWATITCLFILSPDYLTPYGCDPSWLWASIAPFHLISQHMVKNMDDSHGLQATRYSALLL